MSSSDIFKSGDFFCGANYWASHAGTNMWRDWNIETVESDLKRLSEAKITVLRVFPLWPDFQPLKMHRGGGGSEREMRIGENVLPFTPEGNAGIDPVMALRFELFCDLAQKYGFKLIVGLVTGWMSGRFYAPEAFEGMNVLTDPRAVRWEIKFVRYMVRRFKSHPAIAAWDLGNECNCMGYADRNSAYVWTAAITMAIKNEDAEKPVVSGMHSLLPEGAWTPQDQGELLDILCTHPYPIFTPHCDTDPINEMKSALHATAESVMYASLGGKPCFVEEAGTLGPMISCEEVAADYIRASMFTAWAHDLRGFIWWCANDQLALSHTPYDWNDVERELGLFRLDGTKKPVLEVMTSFARFTESFGAEFGGLPTRIIDAVCVLSHGQDQWAAAYGAFILAKQAGLDLEFAYCEDKIPDSPTYLLPALSGGNSVPRHVTLELLEKVAGGATLYMSMNDAMLSPFTAYTGLKVITRSRRIKNDLVTLGGYNFEFGGQYKLTLESAGADVLASDGDGRPVFSVYRYGKGKVYYINFPIELNASCDTGAVSGVNAVPYYNFYSLLGIRRPEKIAVSGSPFICVTEHILDEKTRLLAVANYRPYECVTEITLSNGWRYDKLVSLQDSTDTLALPYSGGFSITLGKNTGAVTVVKKAN
jgi:Endo-beta-mannanase